MTIQVNILELCIHLLLKFYSKSILKILFYTSGLSISTLSPPYNDKDAEIITDNIQEIVRHKYVMKIEKNQDAIEKEFQRHLQNHLYMMGSSFKNKLNIFLSYMQKDTKWHNCVAMCWIPKHYKRYPRCIQLLILYFCYLL